MSNFSSNLVRKFLPVAIMIALGIVFLPDLLDSDSEQPLAENDFLLFESEDQFAQSTISAFQGCLDAEEYSALAVLVTSYSPEFIDDVFKEINPTAYAIDRISQHLRVILNYHCMGIYFPEDFTSCIYEDYYNEVSYIGQIPVRGHWPSIPNWSFDDGGLVFQPLSPEELERRLQPKVIITDEEIFITTISETFHACYVVEVDCSSEAVIPFPLDSLSIKLTEVQAGCN